MSAPSFSPLGRATKIGSGAASDLFDSVKETVKKHAGLIIGVIILLSIIVIYLYFYSEGFNPSSTSRFQRVSLSGSEALDAARPPNITQMSTSDIMSSSDFDCNGRTPVTDDAWEWLSAASQEGMSGSRKPKNDNDFSKILSGR